MSTTHTPFVTRAVGAAIAFAVATAALFLGAATAHAFPAIDNLPSPRDCRSCLGFNPQPDPPSFPDHGNHVSIGNPNDRPPLSTPGVSIGLGGPDTAPPQHN